VTQGVAAPGHGQVMGRWKSDVVREYLYCNADAMWAAPAKQQRGWAGFQLGTVWGSLGSSDAAAAGDPTSTIVVGVFAQGSV
jgi:hypothetical protein